MSRQLALALVSSFIVWHVNSTNEVDILTCSAGHAHNKEKKMIANNSKKYNTLGCIIFFVIIGFASTGLSVIFGKTITVSPMLIFAIIILGGFPHYIKLKIKEEDGDDVILFSRIFFVNLAISTFLSILMIFIYKFALTLN